MFFWNSLAFSMQSQLQLKKKKTKKNSGEETKNKGAFLIILKHNVQSSWNIQCIGNTSFEYPLNFELFNFI